MSIRLGAFDGDPGIRPSRRQFVAYAAPWEPIPDDGLPRHPESSLEGESPPAALRASVDHIDLVVSDLERSLPFYRGLLGPLGWTAVVSVSGERGEPVHHIGGEPPNRPMTISLRQALSDAHPVPYDRYAVGLHHLAFSAPSRAAVDDRHRWLSDQGAAIESAPREYDYTPGYYAVFLYDPDGIKLEIVHKPTGN